MTLHSRTILKTHVHVDNFRKNQAVPRISGKRVISKTEFKRVLRYSWNNYQLYQVSLVPGIKTQRHFWAAYTVPKDTSIAGQEGRRVGVSCVADICAEQTVSGEANDESLIG